MVKIACEVCIEAQSALVLERQVVGQHILEVCAPI